MNWKNDFISLYTAGTPADYCNALDLKRNNLPKRLYRYRPITDASLKYRFNEIVRGELWLSHPKELNDPFECCSHLRVSEPGYYFDDKKLFEEMAKGIFEPKDFIEIFESEKWFDSLIAYISEKSTTAERVEAAIKKAIMSEIERVNYLFNALCRHFVRFASFTTNPLNLPMWNHYTNGHKGICMEYNTLDIQNIYQKNMLFPVFYVEKLPDLTSELIKNRKTEFLIFDYIAMHKLKDWAYEEEWRLIHNAGAWYSCLEDTPEDFYDKGKAIQFIKPSKIILGTQISDDHKSEIVQMANKANVPVLQSKQTEYGLRIADELPEKD
ncbi:MAG: DUF2971 domain-containing protein [Clostridia bacterium]|nr:DUF2971 domain-containing protein [Clostridia bacterium]